MSIGWSMTEKGGFPVELHQALAKDGWLGIAIPEAYGGAGLGITEAAIMMQTISQSGAGMSGASAVHMNIFGLNPVVVFGTEEQKRRMLPPLIAGKERACFAVTEPNTGLDTTTHLKTRAVRDGDRYIVNGQKVWISTAQVAEKVLLLARTTPLEDVKSKTEGLSLFYTDMDRRHVEVREIEKMGRKAVDSNQVFIDGLEVPVDDRIGEEGKGFSYILHGMNPERILIAAEGVGLGRLAHRARRGLREGTHRLRPSHRTEPGGPASARRKLDGARSCALDGDERRLALRHGKTGRHHRRLCQCCKVSRRRSRLPRLRDAP